MGWLELFHRWYNWTPKELMDTDLTYIFDLYAVKQKIENAPRITPIDKAGIF
jgi:hypothetical protein|nr:MAG TPA: hypothetical protein [Caudoviricetes sp.]